MILRKILIDNFRKRTEEVDTVAYITNFERLAMEKGMLQDARELVIDALEEKFGEIPEGVFISFERFTK
jgi:hypothetical protein